MRRYADVGSMDRQQFKEIFDELDKDCIKEVEQSRLALTPKFHPAERVFFDSSFVCLFVRLLQHPPLPQYTSPILRRLQLVFSHYYLTVLGNAVALANVMCICVSLTHTDVPVRAN